MKRMLSILLILLISNGIINAQKSSSAKADYVINAIDIFSKVDGQILIPEEIINDENGVPKTIYYLALSNTNGYGLNNTILCGVDLLKSSYFYNTKFPKESIFLTGKSYAASGLYKFSFNMEEYMIKAYNSNKLIEEFRSSVKKIADKTYKEKAGKIAYGSNNNDITYEEVSIISKGKEVKGRKEKERIPSRNMNFKTYDKDDVTVYEYNSFELSTSKATLGKKQKEQYFIYSINKEGELLTIKKEALSADGKLKEYTISKYDNYSLVLSETFNDKNEPIAKVSYTYDEKGLAKTKEMHRLRSGKFGLEFSYEFFYKQAENSEEGKFNAKQWEVRTTYNEQGEPTLQQKNESRLMRRTFANGQWGSWGNTSY